jgi:polyhydroxyalkanoate synthase
MNDSLPMPLRQHPLPLQQQPERKASAWLGAPSHLLEREHQPGDIDRMLHAWIARFSGHISPVSLALAFFDWAVHLQASPA